MEVTVRCLGNKHLTKETNKSIQHWKYLKLLVTLHSVFKFVIMSEVENPLIYVSHRLMHIETKTECVTTTPHSILVFLLLLHTAFPKIFYGHS